MSKQKAYLLIAKERMPQKSEWEIWEQTLPEIESANRRYIEIKEQLSQNSKKAVEQEKESIKSNFLEYGRLLINMYLPGKLIPENIYDMPFEDFLKLLAMAEIARD